MVAMTVGDEDVSETFALDGGGDGCEVAIVIRARVDDRDLATADHIAVGAEKGVGPGIVGDDAPDAGLNLLGHAVIDILTAIESKLRRHGF
jgi:hypothetical protein